MTLGNKKSLFAGVLLGALAAAVTFGIERLGYPASNAILRGLQTAAFTLVVPALFVSPVLGRGLNFLPVWAAAVCNFVFWLGFGWLFGFLLGELRRQLRLLSTRL